LRVKIAAGGGGRRGTRPALGGVVLDASEAEADGMGSEREGAGGINEQLLEAALRRLLGAGGVADVPAQQLQSPAGGGPGGPSFQQALIWAALGAAAAWVLSDPAIRDKLIRQAIKLYAEMAQGFEEVKAKVAEMKADVDAASHSSQ